MFRIKYLLGILSAAAALLYGGFAILSFRAPHLTLFDQLMPLYLGGMHATIALLLFRSSYREHQRERARLNAIIEQHFRSEQSLTPKQLSVIADISLAEAHEYIAELDQQHQLVAFKKEHDLIVRAFPPHILN